MTDAEWDLVKQFIADAILSRVKNTLSCRLYADMICRLYADMIMVLDGSMCLMSITNDGDGFHYFWTFDGSRSGSNHVRVELADPNSLDIIDKEIDKIVAVINAL